jgi:hypothetical protein
MLELEMQTTIKVARKKKKRKKIKILQIHTYLEVYRKNAVNMRL